MFIPLSLKYYIVQYLFFVEINFQTVDMQMIVLNHTLSHGLHHKIQCLTPILISPLKVQRLILSLKNTAIMMVYTIKREYLSNKASSWIFTEASSTVIGIQKSGKLNASITKTSLPS